MEESRIVNDVRNSTPVENRLIKLNQIRVYTVVFILIVMIGYLPFWINEKLPIYYNDGLGQYYPTFIYIGQWIRNQINNIVQGVFEISHYDLSIGMGESVEGCLNYYGFGDPINLLAIFASHKTAPIIFTVLYFMRLYLAGITFYCYSSYMGIDSKMIHIGVFAYVFCGFALTAGTRYVEMLTAMIYFPLIVLGSEKIMREGKILFMTISVAFSALCGFYFLYMIILYLAGYCVIRNIFIYGKNIKKIVLNCLKCMWSGILGIGLASPVFIPAVYIFFESNRSDINIWSVLLNIRNWIPSANLFIRFLKGFLCGTEFFYWSEVPIVEFILVAMSVFFVKTKRDKQCILAAVLGLAAWTMPITSYIASAFSANHNRWVFMMQFTYCIVMMCVMQNICLNDNIKKHADIIRNVVVVAVIVNVMISVYLHNNSDENNNYDGVPWIDKFVTYDEAVLCTQSPVAESKTIASDDTVYRISASKLHERNTNPENVAMINGYNGLTFWFSVINGNAQDQVNDLSGRVTRTWRSFGFENSGILETLAAVKYKCTDQNIPLVSFEEKETVDYNNKSWNIYQNRNSLPMLYCYKNTAGSDDYMKLSSIQKIVSQLNYAAIYGSDKLSNENNKKYMEYCSDINKIVQDRYDTSDNGIILKYSVDVESQIYVSFDANNSVKFKNAYVYVDSQKTSELFNMESREYLTCVGEFREGENFEIAIEDIEGDSEEIKKLIHVWSIPCENIKRHIDDMRIKDLKLSYNSNKICAEISKDTIGMLVLAIPYSSPWKAYVDGKQVDIYRVNSGYMGIMVEKGSSQIVFEYTPFPHYIGIMVMMVSMLAILYTSILDKRTASDETKK